MIFDTENDGVSTVGESVLANGHDDIYELMINAFIVQANVKTLESKTIILNLQNESLS